MSRNRFSSIKHPYIIMIKKFRFSILISFVVIGFIIYWILQVDDMNTQKQYDSLETALMHDIVHCYAVEGTYPPSLDYIIEHYGLIYDQSLFYVDYQPIGSNIYPDYEIIVLK